ncbi:MAG TPA: threonine--tRNA ligase [Planctomycetaceae bacterium]|nr:threonine--tRNA ligase [Planctomycetaceae bacterium]
MIDVLLPDGNTISMSDDATSLDVAMGISAGLARVVVAAEVDGNLVDAMAPLEQWRETQPLPIKLLTERDAAALSVMRHSCAHVMARAVMRLYEGVSLAFGPVRGNVFYYDFGLDQQIGEDDFPAIEQEMKKIVKEKEPFEQFLLDREQATALCRDLGQELKVEHIDTGLAEHEQLGFYRQGEFVDLCRGPHVPNAGKIKAFKLLSVAGAYWKGDAKNRQLQRIYGTAWFSKQQLKDYLELVEEQKRRDHRVLGKKHGLFHITAERVGSGLCLWLPKGATVRSILEGFLRDEMHKRGYRPVYTPHIGRVELYETSGHFPYYRDSQFTPLFGQEAGQLVDSWVNRLSDEGDSLTADDERKLCEAAKVLGADLEKYDENASKEDRIAALKQWESRQERYLVKPMNCPHHAEIYRSQPRSYRDLPLRLFEFGTVYRHEQTGELNGMLRVRGLTQDDAHIFCTQDQVEDEFRATIELTQHVLESVGLSDYHVQLSLREPNSDKYVGSDENWAKAESALRRVLVESKLPFSEQEGEAAFYGPKADFLVRDCIGRQWQLGTVQLDYNLPERFQLEYVGTDNQPHRPVMIHRAPFGSMERFIGVLIEHFAAAFPLWLAPEQLRVLPLSEKTEAYAEEVRQRFAAAGFRVTTDVRSAKVQAKIRDAQLELIPYMLVVGPREAENGQVAVRDRIDGDLGAVSIDEALSRLSEEVRERRVRQVAESKLSAFSEEDEESNEY